MGLLSQRGLVMLLEAFFFVRFASVLKLGERWLSGLRVPGTLKTNMGVRAEDDQDRLKTKEVATLENIGSFSTLFQAVSAGVFHLAIGFPLYALGQTYSFEYSAVAIAGCLLCFSAYALSQLFWSAGFNWLTRISLFFGLTAFGALWTIYSFLFNISSSDHPLFSILSIDLQPLQALFSSSSSFSSIASSLPVLLLSLSQSLLAALLFYPIFKSAEFFVLVQSQRAHYLAKSASYLQVLLSALIIALSFTPVIEFLSLPIPIPSSFSSSSSSSSFSSLVRLVSFACLLANSLFGVLLARTSAQANIDSAFPRLIDLIANIELTGTDSPALRAQLLLPLRTTATFALQQLAIPAVALATALLWASAGVFEDAAQLFDIFVDHGAPTELQPLIDAVLALCHVFVVLFHAFWLALFTLGVFFHRFRPPQVPTYRTVESKNNNNKSSSASSSSTKTRRKHQQQQRSE